MVGESNLVSAMSFLCEIDPPEITGQGIELSTDGPAFQALVRLGGLVHVENAKALLCLACDHPHSIAVEFAGGGKYRGYCVDSGFQEFRQDELRQYRFDEAWLVSMVRACLSITQVSAPPNTRASALVRIGDCRFGPHRCALFFGRRIFERDRFDSARSHIEQQTGSAPAILLTTTPAELLAGRPPARCGIIQLADVLRLDGDVPIFDERPVTSALRGTAPDTSGAGVGISFSVGFRSASVGDQEFRFSNKQALVVEALWEQHQRGVGQVHQEELQGAANTSQRIGQLFAHHPAYGTFIKNDGEGYYWLEH